MDLIPKVGMVKQGKYGSLAPPLQDQDRAFSFLPPIIFRSSQYAFLLMFSINFIVSRLILGDAWKMEDDIYLNKFTAGTGERIVLMVNGGPGAPAVEW